MKNLFVFFITTCIQCFISCSSSKNCPSTPPIEFRNIRVAFPQTGWEIKVENPDLLFVHGGELTTDSLVWNSHVRWFLTEADLFEMDTSTFLKKANVYGVTFSLFDERNLTDTDLVAELEKQLGGKLSLSANLVANRFIAIQTTVSRYWYIMVRTKSVFFQEYRFAMDLARMSSPTTLTNPAAGGLIKCFY